MPPAVSVGPVPPRTAGHHLARSPDQNLGNFRPCLRCFRGRSGPWAIRHSGASRSNPTERSDHPHRENDAARADLSPHDSEIQCPSHPSVSGRPARTSTVTSEAPLPRQRPPRGDAIGGTPLAPGPEPPGRDSHQPTRQRGRTMKGFRSVNAAQRFLAAFNGISPRFRPHRHLLTTPNYRAEMIIRFTSWDQITSVTGRPAVAWAAVTTEVQTRRTGSPPEALAQPDNARPLLSSPPTRSGSWGGSPRPCALSCRQLEVAAQRAGVPGPRGTRAGRGREPTEKAIRQRLTSRFVRTSRARRSRVARAGSVRSLVRIRQLLR